MSAVEAHPLNVRPLCADDASAFQALRLFALHESPTAFGSSFEEERERTLAQFAAFLSGSPERIVFGAFCDEKLIATVGLGRAAGVKANHTGFIRSLYVMPQHRGQGVGRAMLTHAIQVAMQWPGLDHLTLAVTAGNASALALYQKLGFIQFGRAPRALYVDGQYYDEIQMIRHNHAYHVSVA
jgi:ribosomal protein S18 acetylase RimI-like enzyme